MIATEAGISGIDGDRKRYYDYLASIFREIWDYLKIQDGSVNPQKLELMFDRTVSPYVYWLKENQEKNEQGMSEEKKMTLLKSLAAKYKLKVSEDKFLITSRLEAEDFKRLSENMRIAGYRYDSKERAFVPANGGGSN